MAKNTGNLLDAGKTETNVTVCDLIHLHMAGMPTSVLWRSVSSAHARLWRPADLIITVTSPRHHSLQLLHLSSQGP